MENPTTVNKTKKAKKPKDPDAPRHPRTAYQLFISFRTPSYRGNHPDFSMQQILTLLASDWRNITQEEKSKLQEIAGEKKKLWAKQMEQYKKFKGESQMTEKRFTAERRIRNRKSKNKIKDLTRRTNTTN